MHVRLPLLLLAGISANVAGAVPIPSMQPTPTPKVFSPYHALRPQTCPSKPEPQQTLSPKISWNFGQSGTTLAFSTREVVPEIPPEKGASTESVTQDAAVVYAVILVELIYYIGTLANAGCS